MNTGLALGWACWVAAVAWSRRPRGLAFELASVIDGAVGDERTRGALARWGAAVQGRFPVLGELPAVVVGATLAIGLTVLVVAPQTGVALGIVVVTVARARSIARQRQHRRRMVAQAPATVDLLRLCLDAGMSPRLAVSRVSRVIDAPLRADLGDVALRTERGEALADALAPLSVRGHPLRSLALAVASSERTGIPLGGSLERLAGEARAAVRRSSEERARRLPVLMLLPLVSCVLPAFGLVAVVPMLIGGLGDLL